MRPRVAVERASPDSRRLLDTTTTRVSSAGYKVGAASLLAVYNRRTIASVHGLSESSDEFELAVQSAHLQCPEILEAIEREEDRADNHGGDNTSDTMIFVVSAAPRGATSRLSCGASATRGERCEPAEVSYNFIVEPVWHGIPRSALSMLYPVALAFLVATAAIPAYSWVLNYYAKPVSDSTDAAEEGHAGASQRRDCTDDGSEGVKRDSESESGIGEAQAGVDADRGAARRRRQRGQGRAASRPRRR